MKLSEFNRKLKPFVLPVAMVCGVVFHNAIGYVAFLSPYLIFVMLLITYCKVSWRHFNIDGSMWQLLAIQIFGSLALYFALLAVGRTVAESTFICVLCPTATAAPVITGMLGGKIAKVATYSLLCNIAIAILAPIMFAYMTDNGTEIPFTVSAMKIARSVLPLILGPLVVALLMQVTVPKARQALAAHQGISFYVWAFSLIIVVGNSVSFILKEPAGYIPQMLLMAFFALVVCLAQFAVGRRIGRRYGDAVAGAQSLGQKNTVLAIWLALTYFNPIVSVGPASYVAWHNIVNSWQISRRKEQ